MKALIQTATDSGRSFPDKTTGNIIKVYEVVAGGVLYDCMNPKIMEKIGQEVEFNVQPSTNPAYHSKMFLPKETPAGGGNWGNKKPYTPSFKDSMDGIKLSSKTMLLSYSKDLANNYAQVLPPKSFKDILDNVKAAYEALLQLLELDKLQMPVSVPVQTQTPAPEYHLKPMLETILKGKFKANNFTNRDIIEYCAAVGVVMQNDPQSGDVFINKLSEADANLLINEMNKM